MLQVQSGDIDWNTIWPQIDFKWRLLGTCIQNSSTAPVAQAAAAWYKEASKAFPQTTPPDTMQYLRWQASIPTPMPQDVLSFFSANCPGALL
jgi:hypothetical protein